MTQRDAVTYWIQGSEDARDTCQQLFQSGKYHHALFFLHLSIEKLLKGVIVKKTDTSPLPIHDLPRLALAAQISLSAEELAWLEELSTFNVAARYDDEKLKFYKKATQEYATVWLERGKVLTARFKKSL